MENMHVSISFTLADWNSEADCEAVVALLQAYALHPMGGAEPLSDYAVKNLPRTMAQMPGAFSVLAWHTDDNGNRSAVALANCFTTLSTFACKPLINIHDLYVADSVRGTGTGQAILSYIENEARSRGCCKVTLEVLTGNTQATSAYERFGFVPYELDDKTGHALFMQKNID